MGAARLPGLSHLPHAPPAPPGAAVACCPARQCRSRALIPGSRVRNRLRRGTRPACDPRLPEGVAMPSAAGWRSRAPARARLSAGAMARSEDIFAARPFVVPEPTFCIHDRPPAQPERWPSPRSVECFGRPGPDSESAFPSARWRFLGSPGAGQPRAAARLVQGLDPGCFSCGPEHPPAPPLLASLASLNRWLAGSWQAQARRRALQAGPAGSWAGRGPTTPARHQARRSMLVWSCDPGPGGLGRARRDVHRAAPHPGWRTLVPRLSPVPRVPILMEARDRDPGRQRGGHACARVRVRSRTRGREATVGGVEREQTAGRNARAGRR